jgi:hypothetical protein
MKNEYVELAMQNRQCYVRRGAAEDRCAYVLRPEHATTAS